MNLEAIAPIIEEIIKDNLSKPQYKFGVKVPPQRGGISNKVASGNLRNSVKVNVVSTDNVTKMQVIMADYAQYVQNGRLGGKFKSRKGIKRGKKGATKPDSPFIMSLMDWVKHRGINSSKMSQRQIAYAIRTNIYKFGILASNFIDLSFDAILNDTRIIDLIKNATEEELINAIIGI
jgi:hypothetical protein